MSVEAAVLEFLPSVKSKKRRHETRRGQPSPNEMGRPKEPALDVRSNMRSDIAGNHHGAPPPRGARVQVSAKRGREL
ncbi:hypothetical protein CGRA01v4_08865 [Colletotrichum graminicola]|uniref:Uncharacterized protein n=1 Tax=Colletotrichum graminicola (strain M1.001 / M2 / FGSC 10212) TaxID=645133 RepID=E3Q7K5_COLGM|nr:uncharacterized protein GLRG_02663 [Colletotrichum graminicola M1.001]EFQ26843.1 hypothetical protein GLRG_02663 [Colletotrichum graminicola M1.001]WDK17582.1 hypothetical protein CGRA01v4_08865 [Colletotrichum graminicola]